MRRVGPDGTETRLSTVEILREGKDIRIGQHTGPRNARPSEECRAFVDGYLRLVRTGVLPFDGQGLAAVTRRERPDIDWRREGLWEEILGLWAPHMPRQLRHLDVLAFVLTCENARCRLQDPIWLPDPVTPSSEAPWFPATWVP